MNLNKGIGCQQKLFFANHQHYTKLNNLNFTIILIDLLNKDDPKNFTADICIYFDWYIFNFFDEDPNKGEVVVCNLLVEQS